MELVKGHKEFYIWFSAIQGQPQMRLHPRVCLSHTINWFARPRNSGHPFVCGLVGWFGLGFFVPCSEKKRSTRGVCSSLDVHFGFQLSSLV